MLIHLCMDAQGVQRCGYSHLLNINIVYAYTVEASHRKYDRTGRFMRVNISVP